MSSRLVGALAPDVETLNLPVVEDDTRAFEAVLQGFYAVVDVPLSPVADLENDVKFDGQRERR